ncbi:MAG TPA: glycogen synthase [Polyangiaceae bacterium]|nr:glycogen synthase [Polyangiaceae bacterium]
MMVASECAPVAKVGGLGDVVFGLSRELELRGHSVEIIIPKYDCMAYDQIYGLTPTYQDLWVPWYDGQVHCTVYFGWVHGRKVFFIEPHCSDNFFNRGAFYGFNDEAMRYAFFSKAALEFMLKSGKRPDVIHTHDWQTGLLPVMLFEMYKFHGMWNVRTCHTIHNFRHQGQAGPAILKATGLNRPEYYYHPDRLQDDQHKGAINFTKAAIVYSNFVTTVSRHHAWEARYTEEGRGLGHALSVHGGKFGGIVNGLDYEYWNPETDPLIARRYNRWDLDAKYENKRALRQRLMLRDEFKPIIAYVGRLDSQKGIHLIRHALFWSIWNGCQFVLLGASPEAGINHHFWDLKRHVNDNPDCHLELGFDERLAHLIYAGADMVVVPSMYEPCGLTQLIGLRYGTVPIVRRVGGLSDTVFDVAHYNGHGNGYAFDGAGYPDLESALVRAVGLWNHHPAEFRKLIHTGMGYDYSWNHAGHDYVNIYDHVRHK